MYAAVGDGGDDGGSTPASDTRPDQTEPAATLEEWRRQAAQACSEFREQTSGLNQNPADLQAAAEIFEKAAPLARNFSKQLAEIPAPTANQQDIEQLTAGIDLEAGKFDEIAAASRARDTAAANQAFTEWQTLNNNEQVLFVKLGASGCAT